MHEYLQRNIKDIIAQFPAVEAVLNDYNIGCAPCSLGSCLLKDIVDIHNLSEDDGHELFARMGRIFYPDQDVELPILPRKKKAPQAQATYSPPLKILVDEHAWIKRVLAVIPAIIQRLDAGSEDSRRWVVQTVDFIRNFADKHHHAKEEDILFQYVDAKLDIITTMRAEHEQGRAYVRAISEGAAEQDIPKMARNLQAYRDLLTEHIKKEDEILYVWMDRLFSTHQIGQLYTEFRALDERFAERAEQYKHVVHDLERTFL